MQFCMKYGAFCIQAPVTDTPPCPSPASLIGFLFGCGFGFTGITKRKVAPVDFLGQLESWEVGEGVLRNTQLDTQYPKAFL